MTTEPLWPEKMPKDKGLTDLSFRDAYLQRWSEEAAQKHPMAAHVERCSQLGAAMTQAALDETALHDRVERMSYCPNGFLIADGVKLPRNRRRVQV
jgi:hypothetical protein